MAEALRLNLPKIMEYTQHDTELIVDEANSISKEMQNKLIKAQTVDEGKSHHQKFLPAKTCVLTRAKKRKAAGECCHDDIEVENIKQQLASMKKAEEQEEDRKSQLYRRWLHSPERTKKWRNKMTIMEKAEKARDEGPLTDIWVQCENLDCLKWRRLSKSDSELLDDQAEWFCHMNPREEFRLCSAPQEDFLKVERLASRLGVKYIASSLQEGTLVWTKMPGFVRWPGIITKDFMYNSHVHLDADDEPLSYHVEYLGEEHTHNWIAAGKVQLYGSVDEEEQLRAASQIPLVKKKKKQSTALFKTADKSYFRKNKLKVMQSTAVKEAEDLKYLTQDGRLKHVVFDSKSFIEAPHNEKDNQESAENVKMKSSDGLPGPKVKSKVQNRPTKNIKGRNVPAVSRHLVTTTGTPAPFVTGQEAITRQLNQQVSLIHCTKEERFSIDLEMYSRNEKAFEHDVHGFMIRNNRSMAKSPCWQGINITPFQLFLAVHEQGGYHQVCEKRGWENIFREVTGYHSVKRGMVAKIYYRKNLLPYELYIKNEDYESCLQMTQSRSRSKFLPADIVSPPGLLVGMSDDNGNQAPETVSQEDTAEKDLEEIDQMLSQLEYFQDLSPNYKKEKDYDITFFSESPPQQNNIITYVDLGEELLRALDEPAQQVPDLPEYEDCVYTQL